MANATFTPQQKKLLIGVVLALAVARFIGVPFLEYQAEKRAELAMTTQQLERAQRLLRSELGDVNHEQLREQLEHLENSFLQHSSASEFRLAAQRAVQTKVAQKSAEVQLFDWLTQDEMLAGYLHRHRARVILEGTMDSVIGAQLALQSDLSGVRVIEFAMQQQRAQQGFPPTARLTLLVEVAGVQR